MSILFSNDETLWKLVNCEMLNEQKVWQKNSEENTKRVYKYKLQEK